MFGNSDWQVLMAKRFWLDLAYDSYRRNVSCILYNICSIKAIVL